MLIAVAVVAGAVLVVVGTAFVTWLPASRGTARDTIAPGVALRFWRGYRVFWLQLIAAALSWPHLFELGGARGLPEGAARELTWSAGPARLYRYSGTPTHNEPVLVVHSLVSTSRVLDLAPDASLVRHLVGEGFDVFLLDWSSPGVDEADMGLWQYASLVREAQDVVSRVARAGRIHVLGYCLGATLTSISLSRWPDPRVGSLATIAPPFDMGVPSAMKLIVGSRLFKPVVALGADGCVPPSLVRESFHLIRPGAIRAVVAARRARRIGLLPPAARALSRWVWEQHRLSGAVLFDQVDLMRRRGPFTGVVELQDASYDLGALGVPVLVAVAARDHIVPVGSSLALMSIPGIDARLVVSSGGHVSMISGADARTVLWPALTEWFEAHRAPAAQAVASRKQKPSRRSPARTW